MNRTVVSGARAALLTLVVACAPGAPDAISFGLDSCAFCRMLISDARFAAAIVTTRGRTIKFDSIECMLDYLHSGPPANDVASVWVSDLRHPESLLDARGARFVNLGRGRTPMGRGLAAVASARDAAALGIIDSAAIKHWSDLQ